MRILLINTTEKIGGPAVAASRLMEALKNNGIKAKLLVRDKQTEQITVVELPHNLRMVWKLGMGANRYLESPTISNRNHLLHRRHCQRRHGHNQLAGVAASGTA